MDFHTFKRRDLQALCKLNNKPANVTNAAMADALASLPTVEGLEEILGKLDCDGQGSPEMSAPRTTTRRKAVNQELEGSKMATRTSCRTRTKAAVEGTDTRKTPATRTTRKKAAQEASIQKKMDKDMQAEFEADMEQTEVLGGELQEISEEVSGISVESQIEAQNEVDGEQEVEGGEKNKEEDHVVNEVQDEEASETLKVDFHSLNRKVLQNLCKRNKIPANMTNAAMADALDSLETVEGLLEFVMGCDSQVPSSPMVSGITSSCARRSQTTMRSTKEEPHSSKMITKSCRVSRRRIMEDVEQGKSDVPETPSSLANSALHEIEEKEDSAAQKSEPKRLENSREETSEVSEAAVFTSDISNSLMQEAPVVESTIEDDSGEVSNGHLNVDNLKGAEEEVIEEVSKVDEKVIKEEVLESAEVIVTSCAIQQEDAYTGSAVSELKNAKAEDSSNLELNAGSESEDGQLENLNIDVEDETSREFVGFTAQAELEDSNAEGDMLDKSDTESMTQGDKFSLDNNVGSESEGTRMEDEMSEQSDFEAATAEDNLENESEGTTEDEMPEESDFEPIAQEDQPSLENDVEGESEGSSTEDEMPEETDFETTAQDDQPSLEINVASNLAENLDTTTDSAADASWVEKPEDVHTKDLISNMFDTESTIEATTSVRIEKNLGQQSLRQLKRMLKEQIQQTKSLTAKMDNLTLEETKVPLAKVEEAEECLVESDSVASGNAEAPVPVPEMIAETEITAEEAKDDDEVSALSPVDILLDNEVIPEDAVTGNIDVTICPPEATPSKLSSMTKKPLLLTPKSTSKTPISARRMSIFDNKENIDNSVPRAEPGKIKIAVTDSLNILSPLSMAKLKRDFKQQSERKKQALQQRSENHCPLASP